MVFNIHHSLTVQLKGFWGFERFEALSLSKIQGPSRQSEAEVGTSAPGSCRAQRLPGAHSCRGAGKKMEKSKRLPMSVQK